MSEVTIHELEEHIDNQKILVNMRDAAIRLSENKDFKKLILDGFCLTEAARYAQESGDPSLTPAQRADAMNMAQASGHLKRFLSITIVMGNTAARNISQSEDQIDQIRAEEGDE